MGGWFQLNCAVHVGKISGVTEEQTHGFIAFILFPAETKTFAVPEGRANALWAETNDKSLKFAKYIGYCFDHIVLVENL